MQYRNVSISEVHRTIVSFLDSKKENIIDQIVKDASQRLRDHLLKEADKVIVTIQSKGVMDKADIILSISIQEEKE